MQKVAMQGSVLSVRVDSEVKEAFAILCEELGMTASVAVNMFMRQMVRDQALPFTPAAFAVPRSTEKQPKPKGVLSASDIKSSIGPVVAEYPEIERVIHFGSYARDEATPQSDVDLRIELAEGASLGLFALSELASKLEESLGRHVDIVTTETLDNELSTAMGREGMVIYERRTVLRGALPRPS